MDRIIIFLFLSIFLQFGFAKIVFDFTGKVVKIDDGDTIWVETKNVDYKVRILGIDTPEIVAPYTKIKKYKFYGCGNEAKEFAKKVLGGKIVRIYYDTLSKKRDKYGRLLRYVFIKFRYKTKNLRIPYGTLVIYKGLAKVYKYENFTLKKFYYKLENIAKSKHIGIWSKKCEQEDKAVKQEYLYKGSVYPAKNSSNFSNSIVSNYVVYNIKEKRLICGYAYHKLGCDIKGNISKNGEKIYHLPGRKYYNRTIITPSKGERWFCSEQDAIKCGRRASKIK